MIKEQDNNLFIEKIGNNASVFMFKSKVIWHPHVKTWCGSGYNGKKGCPNIGRSKYCPPNDKNIDEIIDINEEVYVFGLSFNLKFHANKLREKHPKWTQKQCYNIIYWQPKEKKRFKVLINQFKKAHPKLVVDALPEGHGVNITRMMKDAHIPLSWDYPLDIVWRIAIAGQKAKRRKKKKRLNEL